MGVYGDTLVTINEFTGSQKDIDNYKKAAALMIMMFERHEKSLDIYAKMLNDFTDTLEKAAEAKTESAIDDKLSDLKVIKNKAIKEVHNLYAEIGKNAGESYQEFRKSLRSFTVKFSKASVDEKTKLGDIAVKVAKKAYKLGSYYYNDKGYIGRLNKIYAKIVLSPNRVSDLKKAYDELIDTIGWYISECNADINDSNAILSDLRIDETRSSLLYRLLNYKEIMNELNARKAKAMAKKEK